MDLIFRNVCSLSTLVSTYSNANNSHISQYQGPIHLVCGAHLIKLIVTWPCPDQAIKGKSQKRIENKLRPFNWFSDPSFKIVLFQLAWLSWVFSRIISFPFRFLMWQPWVCADAASHVCLQYVHHFELRH